MASGGTISSNILPVQLLQLREPLDQLVGLLYTHSCIALSSIYRCAMVCMHGMVHSLSLYFTLYFTLSCHAMSTSATVNMKKMSRASHTVHSMGYIVYIVHIWIYIYLTTNTGKILAEITQSKVKGISCLRYLIKQWNPKYKTYVSTPLPLFLTLSTIIIVYYVI